MSHRLDDEDGDISMSPFAFVIFLVLAFACGWAVGYL